MGDFFRSEQMNLCQLFMQPEAAYNTIAILGEAGVVQFRDSNPGVGLFQRKFANEVRRCNEMERRLRYIEEELKRDDIPPVAGESTTLVPHPREMIDLEASLENLENEVLELSKNALHLKKNSLELMELRHVIERAEGFLASDYEYRQELRKRSVINKEDFKMAPTGQLGFVAGIVNRERVYAFEQMLWRISRGNVFFKQAEIDEPLMDPASGTELRKTVFVAFYQGDQLKSKVKKVCEGFRATCYPCPSVQSERQELLASIKTRLEDLELIINQTEDHRHRVLFGASKRLGTWFISIYKVKAIFHTLNLFNMDVSKKCLIGECWVPNSDLDSLQKALSEGAQSGGAPVQSFINCIASDEEPPTFNRTNKFTQGFQNLIDSYGVASYREVNPALYTTVTFPFLFAVMFGDVGHGFIVFLFGLYMVLWEKKLAAKKTTNEIWNLFFGGRYIILMMGCFSIYTGFVYNDCFSKSMNIFGSGWKNVYNESTLMENRFLSLDPKTAYVQTPYFIGIDPIWQTSKNNIVFLNSFKMKMSIIFGVIHMMFGVCLSVVNHGYFKKLSNILLEFLPQILFLILLFFYLVIMMFVKWSMYTAYTSETYLTPGCAPSVLILFINMMLMKHTKPLDGCKEYMFEGQDILQYILLGTALACIPVMLFGKPVYKHLNKPKVIESLESKQHDEESFSELMIIQGIHTIEYVLSTVSHTASYLRLWALSLAHAQLSAVLWQMVLGKAFIIRHIIGSAFLFVFFAPWALLTLTILVLMEGLSAFLHTLRLHWVEFMSKFYVGLGYPFQPFSFKAILEEELKDTGEK